jgi:hypothetical protein
MPRDAENKFFVPNEPFLRREECSGPIDTYGKPILAARFGPTRVRHADARRQGSSRARISDDCFRVTLGLVYLTLLPGLIGLWPYRPRSSATRTQQVSTACRETDNWLPCSAILKFMAKKQHANLGVDRPSNPECRTPLSAANNQALSSRGWFTDLRRQLYSQRRSSFFDSSQQSETYRENR